MYSISLFQRIKLWVTKGKINFPIIKAGLFIGLLYHLPTTEHFIFVPFVFFVFRRFYDFKKSFSALLFVRLLYFRIFVSEFFCKMCFCAYKNLLPLGWVELTQLFFFLFFLWLRLIRHPVCTYVCLMTNLTDYVIYQRITPVFHPLFLMLAGISTGHDILPNLTILTNSLRWLRTSVLTSVIWRLISISWFNIPITASRWVSIYLILLMRWYGYRMNLSSAWFPITGLSISLKKTSSLRCVIYNSHFCLYIDSHINKYAFLVFYLNTYVFIFIYINMFIYLYIYILIYFFRFKQICKYGYS